MKDHKPKIKETTDWFDLIRGDTGFALLSSMTQSKTLTVMVIIFIILFGGLALFLVKMAGA